MIILLYGPPGGGKNTQGEALAEKLSLKFVSTGSELREEAQRDTPLAKKMRPYLDSGKMMPATMTGPFMLKRLLSADFQKMGYITDGFPRQSATARMYLKKQSPNVAIFLSVNDDALIARLLKRGRADDKKELLQKRINRYRRDISQVRPLLEATKIPTVDVDGSADQEKVAADIWNAIQPYRH